MKKNLTIILLVILLPIAFKTGEWFAQAFPEMFNYVAAGLLICFIILGLFNYNSAISSTHQDGYRAGRKDALLKARKKLHQRIRAKPE